MCCDKVILLLYDLGFVINSKKSVMSLSQDIQFLGIIINSKEITFCLSEEKFQKVKLQYLDCMLSSCHVRVSE